MTEQAPEVSVTPQLEVKAAPVIDPAANRIPEPIANPLPLPEEQDLETFAHARNVMVEAGHFVADADSVLREMIARGLRIVRRSRPETETKAVQSPDVTP